MKLARLLLTLSPLLLPLSAACGTDDGTGDAGIAPCPDPTFSSLHSLVLTPKCGITGCHASATPTTGNLYLGPDKAMAYAATQGVVANVQAVQPMRVVPMMPAQSFFYVKVSDAAAPMGRMPLGGMLPACDITAINNWITAGAMNN